MGRRTSGNVAFGGLIRDARQRLKMTQEEVASRAKVSVVTYGRIERGEVQPKLKDMQAIFSVIGLNFEAAQASGAKDATALEHLNQIEFHVAELRRIIQRLVGG